MADPNSCQLCRHFTPSKDVECQPLRDQLLVWPRGGAEVIGFEIDDPYTFGCSLWEDLTNAE